MVQRVKFVWFYAYSGMQKNLNLRKEVKRLLCCGYKFIPDAFSTSQLNLPYHVYSIFKLLYFSTLGLPGSTTPVVGPGHTSMVGSPGPFSHSMRPTVASTPFSGGQRPDGQFFPEDSDAVLYSGRFRGLSLYFARIVRYAMLVTFDLITITCK